MNQAENVRRDAVCAPKQELEETLYIIALTVLPNQAFVSINVSAVTILF